jgi:hypothetical protein
MNLRRQRETRSIHVHFVESIGWQLRDDLCRKRVPLVLGRKLAPLCQSINSIPLPGSVIFGIHGSNLLSIIWGGEAFAEGKVSRRNSGTGGQGRVGILTAAMVSCEIIDLDEMAEGYIRTSTNLYVCSVP